LVLACARRGLSLIEVQKPLVMSVFCNMGVFFCLPMAGWARDQEGWQGSVFTVRCFPVTDFSDVSTLEVWWTKHWKNWELQSCGHLEGLHHLAVDRKNCGFTFDPTFPIQGGRSAVRQVAAHVSIAGTRRILANKIVAGGDPVGLQLKLWDVDGMAGSADGDETGISGAAAEGSNNGGPHSTIYEKGDAGDGKTTKEHSRPRSLLMREAFSADIQKRGRDKVFFGRCGPLDGARTGTFVNRPPRRVAGRQPVAPFAGGVFFEKGKAAWGIGIYLQWDHPYRAGSWGSTFEIRPEKNLLIVAYRPHAQGFPGYDFLRAGPRGFAFGGGTFCVQSSTPVDRLGGGPRFKERMYWGTVGCDGEKPRICGGIWNG